MRISAIDGSAALQRISTFVILSFLDVFIRCFHYDSYIRHHISMELLHLTLVHSPCFQHHTAGKKGQVSFIDFALDLHRHMPVFP